MALKGLFGTRRAVETAAAEERAPPTTNESSISAADKLALVEELERAGTGWFWSIDAANRFTYVSDGIVERLGGERERVLGKDLPAVFGPLEGAGEGRSLNLRLSARKDFQNFAIQARVGEAELVMRITGSPVVDAEGNYLGYRGSAIDITAEHLADEETARLAKFDSLTGLANRYTMAGKIEATLTAFRSAKRACALMMMDLDKFKAVNDTLGHAAGDDLLKEVGERLQRVVGDGAAVGRLGGDEFQVLIPDQDDRGALGELAAKIIAILSQPYQLDDGRAVIGASVGIAIAPYDGIVADELVRAADLSLYAAKNGGRGQYRFYSRDLEDDTHLRKSLEADLRGALKNDEMRIDYQPVIDCKSGKVCALEAIMRWEHPERGNVPYAEFAGVAEETRLIIDLSAEVMKQACADAKDWPPRLKLAIDIPTLHFESDSFVPSVASALEETGLPAGRLELGLKEDIFLGDPVRTDRVLSDLFKLGVRLSLDDFGSGFSSLSYLRRAPFDKLKISSSLFQSSLRSESRDFELIRAIVALSEALGMATLASNVSSMELLESMRERGVQLVQGPIFAPAMPYDDVVEYLSDGEWRIEPDGPMAHRSERLTVYRKIHVIHEDYVYEVMLRNLSRTGALIEGLADVPVGTQFVVDLGGGQLAVAAVVRTADNTQGLNFETPLISDGAGGLCTRHRVSPYALAAAGASLSALPGGQFQGIAGNGLAAGTIPKFAYANG